MKRFPGSGIIWLWTITKKYFTLLFHMFTVSLSVISIPDQIYCSIMDQKWAYVNSSNPNVFEPELMEG